MGLAGEGGGAAWVSAAGPGGGGGGGVVVEGMEEKEGMNDGIDCGWDLEGGNDG